MTQRWVFMGNPGAGKSTLLNCILQRPAFNAGISIGSGLTQKSQSEPWKEGIILVDTPGVADIEMREEACAAITEELKRGGDYKLFFVLTLCNGRVAPQDGATCNEVLRSIASHSVNFSLIINNVQRQQYTKLMASEEAYNSAIAVLKGGKFVPDAIVMIPSIPTLDEEDNAIAVLPDDVLMFLMNAPACEILPSAVHAINTNKENYLAELKVLTADMHALKQEKAALQSQMGLLNHSNRMHSHELRRNRGGAPPQAVLGSGQAVALPPQSFPFRSGSDHVQSRTIHAQQSSSLVVSSGPIVGSTGSSWAIDLSTARYGPPSPTDMDITEQT